MWVLDQHRREASITAPAHPPEGERISQGLQGPGELWPLNGDKVKASSERSKGLRGTLGACCHCGPSR